MAHALTEESLKQHLHYNPDTGVFTWVLPRARRVKIGDIAGNTNNRGYLRISIYDRSYLAHRLPFYIRQARSLSTTLTTSMVMWLTTGGQI